jgi:protease-4
MSFYDYIKNIFLVLIALLVAPSLFEGLKKQYKKILVPETQVAIIAVKGVLHDSAYINKYLAKYFKDSDIKAIMLKIECPGGSAGTSTAIYNEIMQLKKEHKKPIISLVENVCASGGYYIASATDYIIAPGTAMIGSIGAAFPYIFQLKTFIEYYNIHALTLKAGDYKNTGNPLTDATVQELGMLQGVLDDSYAQFSEDIAHARNLSLDTKKEWANGKIFTARQARDLKLVDELGSVQNAIAYLKKSAQFEGEIEWVRPPVQSPLSTLFGGADNEEDASMFSSFTDSLCTSIENHFCSPRIQ